MPQGSLPPSRHPASHGISQSACHSRQRLHRSRYSHSRRRLLPTRSKVTIYPCSATGTPCTMLAPNASGSAKYWSPRKGMTTPSWSRPWTDSAALIATGEVLRPKGSLMISTGGYPAESALIPANASRPFLQIRTAGMISSEASTAAAQCSVNVSRLSSSASERYCLGEPLADNGHMRMPAPPHMITGWIVVTVQTFGTAGLHTAVAP